ncbi:MAG: hypothetical protein JXQ80_00985 [Bacteroidales bacterium]|nr:hypothetical protein [Bacteroidales bacterium]
MKPALLLSTCLLIFTLSCNSKDEVSLKQTGKYYALSDLKINVLFPEVPGKEEYGSAAFQVVEYHCFPAAAYDKNFKYSFSIVKSDLSLLANNISQLNDVEKLKILVNALNAYQKQNPNVRKLKSRSSKYKGYRSIITKTVIYNQISDGEDYSVSILFPYKSCFLRLEVITDVRYRNNKLLKEFFHSVKL